MHGSMVPAAMHAGPMVHTSSTLCHERCMTIKWLVKRALYVHYTIKLIISPTGASACLALVVRGSLQRVHGPSASYAASRRVATKPARSE